MPPNAITWARSPPLIVQRPYHLYKQRTRKTHPKAQIQQIYQGPPIQSNKKSPPQSQVRIPPNRVDPLEPEQREHLLLRLRVELFRVVPACSSRCESCQLIYKGKRVKGERERDTHMPELSNFIPHRSFAHCLRSRWNMIDPLLSAASAKRIINLEVTHQPTTAVQYTSGGANMRSSRRRTAPARGRTNTVSDFSSVSQCVVRSGSCAWKFDRSAFRVSACKRERGRGGEGRGRGRTHDVGDHS